MKKIFYKSNSCDEQAKTDGVPHEWYTLADGSFYSEKLIGINPWNQDPIPLDAYISSYDLLDSCVMSIRPARSNTPLNQDSIFYDGYYFIELSNQNGSTILNSRQIYRWEEAISHISLFKELSFQNGLMLWESKKF